VRKGGTQGYSSIATFQNHLGKSGWEWGIWVKYPSLTQNPRFNNPKTKAHSWKQF